MNTIETYQKLEELENFIKGKLNERNQYFWPIIKGWVWRYYLDKHKKQTIKEIIFRHFIKYIIIFYSTLTNFFFFNLTKTNNKIKILFITRKVYERKLKNGLFTDRLIDPLIKLLENATAPKKL